jgi:hypothetical protein
MKIIGCAAALAMCFSLAACYVVTSYNVDIQFPNVKKIIIKSLSENKGVKIIIRYISAGDDFNKGKKYTKIYTEDVEDLFQDGIDIYSLSIEPGGNPPEYLIPHSLENNTLTITVEKVVTEYPPGVDIRIGNFAQERDEWNRQNMLNYQFNLSSMSHTGPGINALVIVEDGKPVSSDPPSWLSD